MGVMTVNGVIRKEELGITSPHEHALIDISNQYPGDRTPGSLGWDGKVAKEHYDLLMADPYALRDNLILDDKEMAVAEVDIFAKAGGGTFVDVTLGHIGRDVEFLKRLSDETGLHVVAATGFYTADAHPERVANMTVEELAEEMIKELTEGIDGTDIKAGIIGEIGTSMELHEDEIKVLKASALAHIKTGAPVMVHLCPWVKHGMQVVDILEEHGVSPESICLCHTDVLLDVEDMRNLLERGVYLEFDNFGKEFTQGSAYGRFPSDEERMEVFYQLIDAGYICNYIHDHLHRSATIYEGEGTYEHKTRYIILTVLKRGQAVDLRNYIKIHEPEAFMMITNSSEVIGKGFRGLN